MQLLGTVRQPLLTWKSNIICVLAGEVLNTGARVRFIQMKNVCNCHGHKHKLFALFFFFFNISSSISNSVFSKVVSKLFGGEMSGGSKHLKQVAAPFMFLSTVTDFKSIHIMSHVIEMALTLMSVFPKYAFQPIVHGGYHTSSFNACA